MESKLYVVIRQLKIKILVKIFTLFRNFAWHIKFIFFNTEDGDADCPQSLFYFVPQESHSQAGLAMGTPKWIFSFLLSALTSINISNKINSGTNRWGFVLLKNRKLLKSWFVGSGGHRWLNCWMSGPVRCSIPQLNSGIAVVTYIVSSDRSIVLLLTLVHSLPNQFIAMSGCYKLAC